jgi:hypothetical protein
MAEERDGEERGRGTLSAVASSCKYVESGRNIIGTQMIYLQSVFTNFKPIVKIFFCKFIFYTSKILSI